MKQKAKYLLMILVVLIVLGFTSCTKETVKGSEITLECNYIVYQGHYSYSYTDTDGNLRESYGNFGNRYNPPIGSMTKTLNRVNWNKPFLIQFKNINNNFNEIYGEYILKKDGVIVHYHNGSNGYKYQH